MKKNENKRRKNTQTKLQNENKISWISHLPLYLIVAVIPHLYGYAAHTYAPSEAAIFGQKGYIDVYLIWKARGLFVLTIFAATMFLWNVFSGKIKLKWDYFTISVSIMTGIILISTFTSKYQDVVYIGGRERFEGMYVYLCYMAIMFIARYYGNNEKFVKNISTFLMYSVFAMSIPIFFQAFGYDLYTMSPLVWVFYPAEVASRSAELISMNMAGGTVGALFNSNYSGVFMLMGLVVALWKTLEEESTKKRIFYLIIASLTSFGVLTSKSDASMLAFSICMPLFFFYNYGKYSFRNKVFIAWIGVFVLEIVFVFTYLKIPVANNKYFLPLVIILSILAVGFRKIFKDTNGKVYKALPLVMIVGILILPYVMYLVLPYNHPELNNPKAEKYDVLKVKGNSIMIKYNHMNDVMKITFEENKIIPEKPEKTDIKIDSNNDDINITFDNIKFKFKMYKNYFDDGSDLILLKKGSYIGDVRYKFNPSKNEVLFWGYDNKTFDNEVVNKIRAEKTLFKKPKQFSNRAEIWSKFIPLASDRPFIGHGADAFIQIYPQNDYKSKYNLVEPYYILVDKPHSLYLDYALNYGIIFVLGFIGLAYKSIYNSFSIINANISTLEVIIFVVLMSGLFNDSILGISQILFIYIGIFNGISFVEKRR